MPQRRWHTMMVWYDHNVSGWGWFAMSAGMLVFWA